MTDIANNRRLPGARRPVEKALKKETAEVCEICGQRMQTDPESGEYFCPDCYNSEDKP